MENIVIRQGEIRDLERLTDIYNQAINAGYCTCDTEKVSVEARREWFKINENPRTPVFVALHENETVGYAYLSPYRGGRPAVKDTAEISYYLDFNYVGKGIGSALFEHTVAVAKELKYSNLVAILLSCNTASIALLQKYGFEEWGRMPDIACIGGKYHSHLYYGRKI